MPKHKNQRVGVFVDVQNLYYSAKQFYKAKVNFAHILKTAVSGRQLIRAIAYVIKADVKEESNFFEALEKIGYDVRSKDLQTFYTGAKKGDWDVGIAMDIMRMAAKLDVVVLVSGDGDFKDLLEHCKALGCRAEVIAFGKTSSSRLLAEADEMIDLGKDLSKALIKPFPQRQQKSENKPAQFVAKKPPFKDKPKYQNKAKPPYKGNNTNKSNNNYKPRPFNRNPSSGPRDNELSLLQKINMEQPDLVSKKETTLKMPEKKTVVKKKPVKKATKKTAKKAPAKKPAKKTTKKDSLVKKVIKRVGKK